MTTTASGGPQLPASKLATTDTDLGLTRQEEETGTALCTPTPPDLRGKPPRRQDDSDPAPLEYIPT